jgi:hypothetical protein
MENRRERCGALSSGESHVKAVCHRPILAVIVDYANTIQSIWDKRVSFRYAVGIHRAK